MRTGLINRRSTFVRCLLCELCGLSPRPLRFKVCAGTHLGNWNRDTTHSTFTPKRPNDGRAQNSILAGQSGLWNGFLHFLAAHRRLVSTDLAWRVAGYGSRSAERTSPHRSFANVAGTCGEHYFLFVDLLAHRARGDQCSWPSQPLFLATGFLSLLFPNFQNCLAG